MTEAKSSYEKAAACFEKACAKDPSLLTPNLAEYMGIIHSLIGNHEKSRHYYKLYEEKGGKIDPERAWDLKLQTALGCTANGEWAEAKRLFEELEQTRKNLDTRNGMAEACLNLKEYDKALEIYHDLWKNAPEDRREFYKYKKVECLFSKGDYEAVLKNIDFLRQTEDMGGPEYQPKYIDLENRARIKQTEGKWINKEGNKP